MGGREGFMRRNMRGEGGEGSVFKRSRGGRNENLSASAISGGKLKLAFTNIIGYEIDIGLIVNHSK